MATEEPTIDPSPLTRDRGFDPDVRWVVATCLILWAAFFTMGMLSEGMVNDDDLGRYLNTRGAIRHPDQLLSLWNRPAFVVAYLLPAQLGYWAVELLTAAFAACTCFLTYRVARSRGLPNAFMVIPLLAFQPDFFMLSFSALVEPLAAFLLAASLASLHAGRYRQSAVWAALMPLARLELTVILGFWAIGFLRNSRWKEILILPLGLLVWNIAGAIGTGDPLYLYNQIFTGEERTYEALGFWHYPSTYIFVVGPVVFAFVILGLFRETVARRLDLVHLSFVTMFLVYIWLSWKSSAGQAAGFLRHFVALSPLVALIALQGLNHWIRGQPLRSALLTLGSLLVVAGLVAAFLSRELSVGIELGSAPEYWKLACVGALALVSLFRLLPRMRESIRPPVKAVLLVLVVALAVTYFGVKRSPIPLSPEQKMIREAAVWYRGVGLKDRATYCNHAWFHYFNRMDHLSSERSPVLNKTNLDVAPMGAIAVWEGHYAHRLRGDVKLVYFDASRDWFVRQRFLDSDNRTFAVVFEKVDGRGSRVTDPDQDRYVNEGLGIAVDLLALSDWRFDLQEQGQVLLYGAHRSRDITFSLGFERLHGIFTPLRRYVSALGGSVHQDPSSELIDAKVEPSGTWGRVRFVQHGREHSDRASLSERQGMAIRLRFEYPSGESEEVADAILDVAKTLNLEAFY